MSRRGRDKRRWQGLAAAVLLVMASAAAGGRDFDEVQGCWVVASRWAFNARQPVWQPEAEFAVDTLRLCGGEGAFLLDESQRPKQLRHLLVRPGAADPVTIHYIYMLDGDELVLARKSGIGANDGTVDPPAEFNAGQVEVIRLRRPPQR